MIHSGLEGSKPQPPLPPAILVSRHEVSLPFRVGTWAALVLLPLIGCGGSQTPVAPDPTEEQPPADETPAYPIAQGIELSGVPGGASVHDVSGDRLVGWDTSCPNLGFVYDLATDTFECLVLTGFAEAKYSVRPRGVNAAGVVVGGISDQETDDWVPFVVDYPSDPGTPILLARRSGWEGVAEGITEAGHVVGFMRSGSVRWVIWDTAGDTLSVSGRSLAVSPWAFSEPDDGSLPFLVGPNELSGATGAAYWDGTAGADPVTLDSSSYEDPWPQGVGPDGTIYGRGQVGEKREVIAWADVSAEPTMVADFEDALSVHSVDERGNLAVVASSPAGPTSYCIATDDAGGITELAPLAGHSFSEAEVMAGDRVYGRSGRVGSGDSFTVVMWDLSGVSGGCPVL